MEVVALGVSCPEESRFNYHHWNTEMTAQRISQPRDLLYYRELWKIHAFLKQIAFIISSAQKPMGWKNIWLCNKSRAFYYWTVCLDFSTAEKSVFSVGLKTNFTPQSLPILISFYRHNKSSGTHINGGVMCCLHPSEPHIQYVFNSLFMSFSPESIHSLLILYICDLELCLKWLDHSRGSAAEMQEAFCCQCFQSAVFLPAIYSVHICFTSLNI